MLISVGYPYRIHVEQRLNSMNKRARETYYGHLFSLIHENHIYLSGYIDRQTWIFELPFGARDLATE